MRLDFNVLWVDDQPTAVASQIERLKIEMESEGFKFKPIQLTSLTEVDAHIANDIFQDEIDLILVDWDLGNELYGQEVIQRVRQVALYKDVVFYSGQTAAVELRKLAFDAGLDGVFCASREGLVEEILGFFESLVKRVLDLDHTRGIVMGATSDIDNIIKTCLTATHAKLNDEKKQEFIQNALQRISDKVKNIKKQEEKIKSNPSVDALFKAHMLFSSDDRLRMLSSILAMDVFSIHAEATEKIKHYKTEVLPMRNKLGHMVLTPEGKPEPCETEDDAEKINLDEMKALRTSILMLREEFRSLASSLMSE